MSSALVDLRHRLEYALLMVLVGIVRLMRVDTAAAVSSFIWGLVAPRLRRHRRALDNLAIAFPEKTVAEREAIARAMWPISAASWRRRC